MLKQYLQYKKTTMYRLAKENNIPYSNINSIANNIIKAEKISSGLLYNIAKALNITMDELYLACDCNDKNIVFSERYNSIGFIIESDNQYSIKFFFNNKPFSEELPKTAKNPYMIAKQTMENIIRKNTIQNFKYKLTDIENKNTNCSYRSSKGKDFIFKKEGDNFRILFIHNDEEISIPYEKFFPDITEKNLYMEATRMGFIVDNYIKKSDFSNEVKKYYARKQLVYS